jgi:quinol monooxygenase YgiN
MRQEKAEPTRIGRRELLAAAAAALAAPHRATGLGRIGRQEGGGRTMYGLIGRATAVAGKRDELIAILLEGTGGMPGCLSYVVAKDTSDPDGIWITEVWDSRESHDASLSLPDVRAAIAKGRPLFASFDPPAITEPVGGVGLP